MYIIAAGRNAFLPHITSERSCIMDMSFIWGLVIVLAVAAVVFIIFRKSSAHRDYDERQLMLRAQGYRLGFFVTLLASAAVLLLTEVAVIPAASFTLALFTALMAGIVSFAVFCIWNDVFFPLNERGTYYYVLYAAIAVLYGVMFAAKAAKGAALENGVPTFGGFSSLVMAVSFLVILGALLFRKGAEARSE